MLTLLEPPGRTKNVQQGNRSAQHLLSMNGPDDSDYDPAFDPPADFVQASGNFFTRWLDRFLVWQTSSDEFNERWRREFHQRPSWCDADLCMQQIKQGRARGNKWALYSRSFIQKTLFGLGQFVHSHAYSVMLTILILFSICCYGLKYVHIETDIVKLWVSKGGRLDEELNFLPNVMTNPLYQNVTASDGPEIVRENGLGGGYQVIIQTSDYPGQNILTRNSLLKHVDIMTEIANYQVNLHGVNWTLSDICFKPSPPDLSKLDPSIAQLVEKVIPCIWITPIDCYWEGGKALGPNPPVPMNDLGFFAFFLDLPDDDFIRFTSLDPMSIITQINSYDSIGSHYDFFKRSGVGKGYIDRPCMDPLDADCSRASPNYYDVCPAEAFATESTPLDKFLAYAKSCGIGKDETGFGSCVKEEEEDNGEVEMRKRRSAENETVTETTVGVTESATTLTSEQPATTEAPRRKKEDLKKLCKENRSWMLKWMNVNADKWNEFLTESEQPSFPDYAQVMSKGCSGFAKNVLHWPTDMIIGSAKKDSNKNLVTAEALQSVFLVASPADVYLRFKERTGFLSHKPSLNQSLWNETLAEEVITTWQRNFTNSLYNHRANFDGETERRTIHPLASTSIADMLDQFCNFNYGVILVGYGLMLAYAIVTQWRQDGCLPASDSCIGLALAGVLVVTFASVSGLGLATWFGIEFNAATTQIVPFLSLGIGVDNMFMLLHNYHDTLLKTSEHEIALLLKETGMSILCSSINNILSFLAGTMLPIPALKSFCAQCSILLTFNFIAIITIYPAIISIDLRRRKMNLRDIFCCFSASPEDAYSMISLTKPNRPPQKKTIGSIDPSSCNNLVTNYKDVDMEEEEEVPWYTLQGMIRYCYIPLITRKSTRFVVLLVSLAFMIFAMEGIRHANVGLELGDILPEHTAPAQFLRARDKYFSFYPMFAVLKGPNIDYPRQQHLIGNYRRTIGASKYVVKGQIDEPSEKYWLDMMRDWLFSIQRTYDEAVGNGCFDPSTGNFTGKKDEKNKTITCPEDAKVAYQMMCSAGEKYDCAGRVGKIRLVDASGTINYEGFYNYLTGWYNQENMMYYVSQASFFPLPPKWSLAQPDSLVPPAMPLAYSQIPFYLTGLTDTPVIIDMIEDIRSVCERFADQGLPNFPQGIAFTFWEQYLHLNKNLFNAVATIAFAVFLVISVLLFNPWAAATVLVVLVVMIVELAGFMGYAGIKLNPVSAVTLITAVGIGVEFTAHIVLAYLTSLGTREQRTAAAVDRVFVPVIHGSFSTLLGILMLGFSEFEFVVKYFFVVMTALIVVGCMNGLVLMPVLLSFAGPPQEVFPKNGKSTLNLPQPLRRRQRQRNIGAAHFRVEEDDDGGAIVMVQPQSRRGM